MTEPFLPKERREFLRQQYGHDRQAFPDLFEALDDLDAIELQRDAARNDLIDADLTVQNFCRVAELACTIQLNSAVGQPRFAIVDVDGEVVAKGSTPQEAAAAAMKELCEKDYS